MDLPPTDQMGPKMRALWDDRVRKFAWIMAGGERDATSAARKAGYADKGGRSSGVRVQAHSLMHNQRVIDAIQEASRIELYGLAPVAVRAAKAILADPEHPGHARMIETVLDRTGHFAETKHTMTVEHKADTKELEDLARRLGLESGVDPRKLIGGGGLVIEGEVVDGD